MYNKLKELEFVDNISEQDKDEVYYLLKEKDLLADNFLGRSGNITLQYYKDRNSNISKLDFSNAYLSLEKWDLKDIVKIHPTDFSENFCNDVADSIKKLKCDYHKYYRFNSLNEYLLKHWDKYKTYETPIVIISGNDFEEAKIKKEYQLFEGHTRFGWIKGLSGTNINNKHYVIVLRKRPN